MSMNLKKISKNLQDYISKVSNIKMPDVYDLYSTLGEDIIGRKIYKYVEDHSLVILKIVNTKKLTICFGSKVGHCARLKSGICRFDSYP